MMVDVVVSVNPSVTLGDREELTEQGVVEKVVHSAHASMETQLTVRLFLLGVPPEQMYSNMRLSPNANGTRYNPDLCVVRDTNPVQPEAHADYAGAPDLIVEILSPGDDDRARDLEEKRRAYATRGVPHYWIADPDRRTITDGYLQEDWRSLDEITLPW